MSTVGRSGWKLGMFTQIKLFGRSEASIYHQQERNSRIALNRRVCHIRLASNSSRPQIDLALILKLNEDQDRGRGSLSDPQLIPSYQLVRAVDWRSVVEWIVDSCLDALPGLLPAHDVAVLMKTLRALPARPLVQDLIKSCCDLWGGMKDLKQAAAKYWWVRYTTWRHHPTFTLSLDSRVDAMILYGHATEEE